jgi:hypothetical protein
VLPDANPHHLIANCDILICQLSTLVFTGLALGKEVHSYFDDEELRKLVPRQNGGTSKHNIARVCEEVLAEC